MNPQRAPGPVNSIYTCGGVPQFSNFYISKHGKYKDHPYFEVYDYYKPLLQATAFQKSDKTHPLLPFEVTREIFSYLKKDLVHDYIMNSIYTIIRTKMEECIVKLARDKEYYKKIYQEACTTSDFNGLYNYNVRENYYHPYCTVTLRQSFLPYMQKMKFNHDTRQFDFVRVEEIHIYDWEFSQRVYHEVERVIADISKSVVSHVAYNWIDEESHRNYWRDFDETLINIQKEKVSRGFVPVSMMISELQNPALGRNNIGDIDKIRNQLSDIDKLRNQQRMSQRTLDKTGFKVFRPTGHDKNSYHGPSSPPPGLVSIQRDTLSPSLDYFASIPVWFTRVDYVEEETNPPYTPTRSWRR